MIAASVVMSLVFPERQVEGNSASPATEADEEPLNPLADSQSGDER